LRAWCSGFDVDVDELDQDASGDAEKFPDLGRADGVDDLTCFAANSHELGLAEYGKLLGEVAGADRDFGEQLVHRVVTLGKELRARIRTGWPSVLKNSALAW
jgi:hypothetical protein